jgi:hypothetical protein
MFEDLRVAAAAPLPYLEAILHRLIGTRLSARLTRLPQISPRNLRKFDCYANRCPIRLKTP